MLEFLLSGHLSEALPKLYFKFSKSEDLHESSGMVY